MKFTFNRLSILLILFCITSLTNASETGYEVELIIFEDTKNRYLNSEDWSYNDMLNNTIIKDNKNTTKDPEYAQLPWDEAKLAKNLERLNNNSNYRVLVKKRWKQTGLDREHSFNIPVNEPVETNPSPSTKPNESSSISLDSTVDVNSKPYVTGNVKLIMSRYLHFSINIKYIKPQFNSPSTVVIRNNSIDENNLSNDSSIKDENDIIFPIVDERRMRSREIHYIDHPMVGIIVLATPYKLNIEEETKPSEYKTM